MSHSLTGGISADIPRDNLLVSLPRLPISGVLLRCMLFASGITAILIGVTLLFGRNNCPQMIAFIAQDNNLALMCLDNPGLLHNLVYGDTLQAQHPSWSPDGQHLMFVGINADNISDIYITDTAGHQRQRLTDGQLRYETPVWSPDMRRIAFSADGRIFIMNADGTQMRALTDGRFLMNAPQWSPDGQLLAMVRSNRDIQILTLATGRGERLRVDRRFTEGVAARLSWSSDGQWIVFSAMSAPFRQPNIYTAHTQTHQIQRLTASRAQPYYAPAWSLDNRYILFSTMRINRGQRAGALYLMDDNGENMRALYSGQALYPAWRP